MKMLSRLVTLMALMVLFTSNQIRASRQMQEPGPKSLFWSSDGQLLGTYNGEKACVYRFTDSDEVDETVIPFTNMAPANVARFLPPENMLIAGHEDGTVSIRDIPKANVVKTLKLFDESIADSAVNSDGTLLVISSEDSPNVQLWNTESYSFETSIVIPGCKRCNPFTRLVFSPDGTQIALLGLNLIDGHRDPAIAYVWDIKSPSMITILYYPFDETLYFPTDIAFSNDNQFLLVSTDRGWLMAWNVETDQFPELYPAVFEDSITSIDINNENMIALGSSDISLAQITENNTVEEKSIIKQTTRAMDVAFNPVTGTLATIDRMGEINLWDVVTGESQQSFTSCLAE